MLYDKIKHLSLDDAIKIEESDPQFFALREMYSSMLDDVETHCNSSYRDAINRFSKVGLSISSQWQQVVSFYLSLIVCNSLVCYQLSWKWEDYWSEFSKESVGFFSNNRSLFGEDRFSSLMKFFSEFLANSKNNRRFVQTKLNRILKARDFISGLFWKEEFYYEDMIILRDFLSKEMKQKKDAKTIVFAVKMFSYWARNIFWFRQFPNEISIPLDSRLTNLYEKYNNWKFKNPSEFYKDLSIKTKIPPLHLDAILWVNYDELIW